ncbi:alpha/beta hydrolase [Spirosoma sp. BT702]|uniref:Alpha/beta hydrolase n=1 Tax=Spirosoma profusum TaxID=2771354 RepID=A0A926XYZ9_9BACT|nr:alpha/beta hydrolase [Spirosoma profusum]MBD2702880.1 alpha/beta hydrolase [Spirosoma profusum]
MNIYKLLKKPFFGNFMVKWRSPLLPDQQKEWIPVSVKSKSGGILKGLLAKSKTAEEKATIVLGHPMGKEAKGYFIKNGYTDLLRKHGFNTLVFDINGFGESTFGNFSYQEDIVAISIKASELTPDIPIGYHGISLGGQMATIAFADPNHTFSFAIVESAATTLEEFWIKFPVAYKTLRLFNFLMPAFRKKVRMIDRIKEAKHLKSLLLIYSKTDDWVSVDMGMRFKENSPVETELWTVETAKHAAIMKSEHKDKYMEKILDYFDSSVKQMATSYC